MKVSIITINFNDKKGLENTIKSVISQTFADFEFIVIDGGSKDGSLDVLQKYDKNITQWISEPDNGIYHAMNKGIQLAKGEYIHFLNSADCYYSNDVLEYFFSEGKFNSSLIRGVAVLDEKSGQREFRNHEFEEITFYQLYYHTIQHQATFIRRDLFDKYGLYDETYKIVSDWLFFAKVILHGEKSIFVDKRVVLFDVNGISTTNEEKTNNEKMMAMKTLLPDCVIEDYEAYHKLKQNYFSYTEDPSYNFLKAHKFPQLIIRALHKMYIILGL